MLLAVADFIFWSRPTFPKKFFFEWLIVSFWTDVSGEEEVSSSSVIIWADFGTRKGIRSKCRATRMKLCDKSHSKHADDFFCLRKMSDTFWLNKSQGKKCIVSKL